MIEKMCCCLSGRMFQDCCAPFLAGDASPRTPEQLMRSRYTAFCRGKVDYLLSTHHPSKRTANEHEQLAATIRGTKWLGLKIVKKVRPRPGATCGTVEFAAFYENGDTIGQLHELSRFVFEENQWYYLDGELKPPLSIGRNEPCFCGSGKKFKKCHGR